jgi:hypothetical protein
LRDLRSGQKQPAELHCPRTKWGCRKQALPQALNASPVKKGKPTPPKAKVPRLKPLPPNAPAARDEGPRLLPLTAGKDQTGLEHFLRLADVALGRKRRDRLP